jgi:hypothetical protein
VKVGGRAGVDGCLADLGEDFEGQHPLLFLEGDEDQGEEYFEDGFLVRMSAEERDKLRRKVTDQQDGRRVLFIAFLVVIIDLNISTTAYS